MESANAFASDTFENCHKSQNYVSLPELVLLFDDVSHDGRTAVVLGGLPLEVGVVLVPIVDIRYAR